MLNKEICRQCINQWAVIKDVPNNGWNKDDEKKWTLGRLNCPNRPENIKIVKTEEEPLIQCAYRIEQLMKAQKC
jgi:hypothetical protein